MKHLLWLWGVGAVCLLAGCPRPAATNDEQRNTPRSATTPAAVRVVGGLQEPVALAFLSDTVLLVAERRSGRIRWVEQGQLRAEPFAAVPAPPVRGYAEYGLLGLTVDRRDPARPLVYVLHTVPDARGQPVRQRIARFTVQEGRGAAETTIVDNLPVSDGCCHFGGRVLLAPDGLLYATVGDIQRPQLAQQSDALAGKVLRYRPDGTVPADNPFGADNPVYTLGHRNPFGIAADPATGNLYITENGPNRDDEINRLAAGSNYGWPQVTGAANDRRFRDPLWASGNRQYAPTGIVVYTGALFPQYRGHLLFASYNDGRLRRAILDGADRISAVEVIDEAGANARLDVAVSPDGHIYYSSTDAIYRLQPQ